ncbi:MAG: hypothetical protein DI628_08795 [Blastochloris viridis]|uniref:Uncharacterized protein n=1 Tax=Blastochloris viridis TaxID=1079 RepID=A0A6N4R945_BLAVI|nr:MAG: hypothetical protein DI628_08795 [Blastochloris viridis]
MSSTPPNTPSYAKFGFDTEFFELVQGQKGAPSVVAPSSPQQKAQLEEIRRAGYDEGFAAGLAEGQMQAQADLAQIQQHLQNTLISLQKAVNEREEELLKQMLTLLRQTLHHVIGHAVRQYPAELFEHHLRTLLPLLGSNEALTLRLHPSARGYHEKLALPQASIMGMPMNVKSDPTLGPTDAVVEWANGGVENKLELHLKAIDELLSGAGAALLPVESRADLSPQPASQPEAAPASAGPIETQADASADAAPDDMESAAAKAARDRARQLLGDDDDDLVDALK